MKYILLLYLISLHLIVLGQDTTYQVAIVYKSNQQTNKKKTLPAKIHYKFKNAKGKKKHAILYDIRNDTLICKNKRKLTDTLLLLWNDLKWVQIERNGPYSLLYDGAILASYFGVGFSIYAISYGLLHPPNYHGAVDPVLIGAFMGAILLPTAIILTTSRFREFKTEKNRIEKRIKKIE